MEQLPTREKSNFSLQKLRDEYERALTQLLDHLGSEQVSLVLSKRLGVLLNHVFVDGLGHLKNHHVVECLELTDDISSITATTTVVYLAFARIKSVRAVAAHAEKLLEQEDDHRRLALYVVGKWTSLLDQVLDNGKVRGRIQTGEVVMGFFPLDTDLLTLGFQRTLYEYEVEGDSSSLLDMAAALQLLQQIYGNFRSIKYKGEMSMVVLNHLFKLNEESTASQEVPTGASRSRLDTLILLDRSVDFASVFSTPLTYEAILDELMQIQDGIVTISPKILRIDDSTSESPVSMALNSSDSIYREIRDKHIHTVPETLNVQAEAIKEQFLEFQRVSTTATAAEVNEFVKAVPMMKTSQQSIEQHLNLLEYLETTTSSKAFRELWNLERKIMDQVDGVLDSIQDLIYRCEDLVKVLRLLCLFCVVNDGLVRKDLERMKLNIVRTYGHELIYSFRNLEKVGVLYEKHSSSSFFGWKKSTSSFQHVARGLSVIDVDINITDPKNAAFVTSGYAPISAHIVKEILKHGHWRGIDDVMSHLPGPRAEMHLVGSEREIDAEEKKKGKSKKKGVTVVAFVGGVTFLEIAALRWIASFYPTELVIVSTSILNGNVFTKEVVEQMLQTTYTDSSEIVDGKL